MYAYAASVIRYGTDSLAQGRAYAVYDTWISDSIAEHIESRLCRTSAGLFHERGNIHIEGACAGTVRCGAFQTAVEFLEIVGHFIITFQCCRNSNIGPNMTSGRHVISIKYTT